MRLTGADLAGIRTILKEELEPIQGEIKVSRNNIKDIYAMISNIQKLSIRATILKVKF
jgi:hypothetical protein